jgi:hypothetical protein
MHLPRSTNRLVIWGHVLCSQQPRWGYNLNITVQKSVQNPLEAKRKPFTPLIKWRPDPPFEFTGKLTGDLGYH